MSTIHLVLLFLVLGGAIVYLLAPARVGEIGRLTFAVALLVLLLGVAARAPWGGP